MRIDRRRSLRRLRPESFRTPLVRRADRDLTFPADAPLVGPPLVLDTTVYIDTLEGTIPTAVEALLAHRPINHLSVILGELSHHFGRLDPNHPNTRAALPALASVIEEIPLHRVESASPGVVLEAGILAGLLIRLGGLPRGSESTALTDATLCLHALEKGAVVLTRNIRDFDLLDQIAPTGRVIFYRAE